MTYTRLCHRWLMFLNWLINAVVLPQTEKKLCSPSQSSTADLAFGSLIHHEGWCYTAGPNCKNPPKINFKKFMKLMNHTCTCNDSTSFEYKSHPPETEIVVNLLKVAWKNSWNHIKWNYFMAGFSYLEPLCAIEQCSGVFVHHCCGWSNVALLQHCAMKIFSCSKIRNEISGICIG